MGFTVLCDILQDENDNSPQFYGTQPIRVNVQVDDQLLMAGAENVFLARIHVDDADAEENGRLSLRILPPMDRYLLHFTFI